MGYKRILLVLLDVSILMVAVCCVLILRWDLSAIDLSHKQMLFALLTVCSFLISFYWFKIYHCMWQYAGLIDFLNLPIAVTVGTLISLFLNLIFNLRIPWEALLLLWAVSLMMLGGIRFCLRVYWNLNNLLGYRRSGKRTLIIGAGEAGALLVRTIQSSKTDFGFKPVGFVDDDPAKKGLKLYGIPILGETDQIPKLIKKFSIEEIIIAIPSDPERMREIAFICKKTGIRISLLPGVIDILQGKQLLHGIQNLQMEDLLKRNEVEVDLGQVTEILKNQVVLVTGAGGSIGSELCRQVSNFQPRRLILLGRGENSIYEINLELSKSYSEIEFVPVIADIRDYDAVEAVFTKYQPAVVFHAAAHKHVNFMQLFPEEAFKNNVFGTLNLAKAAHSQGVKRFVLISTDKAVNPTNVMGATKLLAEMIIKYYAEISPTVFAAVRFGNVVGSRGSVVQLFRKQIAAGGPVTVTHPEMRRYFMTISEAVKLVMEAGAFARGGEVFILDMGEQVKIVDLAKDMIRLSGLIPYEDIDIKFIGAKPGEKLSEELVTDAETTEPTEHEKIFMIEAGARDNELLDIILGVSGHPKKGEIELLKSMVFEKYNCF